MHSEAIKSERFCIILISKTNKNYTGEIKFPQA